MHFFKIFHTSIIRDKRLKLPKEFARKFGEELSESDHAIIQIPNGVWHIGMRKAEGLVYFENGWPEFMEFYSIRVGHLIVFRYNGYSKFQVHIFGMNATEIKYPFHFENTDHQLEVLSTHSDDVELISAHPAAVDIISVHSDCSTHSNNEPSLSTLGVFASNEDNYNQTVESGEPSMSTLVEFASSEGRLNQEAEPATHEFPQASRKRKAFSSKFTRKRSYTTALQASRLQESALEAAEKFTSDNPFYKVLMRPSYVRGGYVRVPMVFAKRYMKIRMQMEATLGVSDGRTWEVLYLARAQHDRRLSQGWPKFVSENHLKEGDICVFELVDRINIEMKVHIFRVSQEIISIHSSSGTQTKYEPPMSTSAEFASNEGRVNQKAEPTTHEFPQASRKRKTFSSKFPQKRSYTTAFQASRLLESALEAAEDFTSDNPFYKILMRPSYVKGGYVVIPKDFGTSCLKKGVWMVVTLRVSDGRTWKVRCVSRSRNTTKLSLGWNEFATDNYVKQGDVCVFELVDRINFEMLVHIFRV